MPLTVEFFAAVLVSLLLVSVLASIILAMVDGLKQAGSQESVGQAKEMAVAISSALNDGADVSFDSNFSIEQGRLHIDSEGKIIEIGGVFEHDESEPV